MKPARGSGRKSTQGPVAKGRARKGNVPAQAPVGRGRAGKENVPNISEDPGPSTAGEKQRAGRKRNRAASSGSGQTVRGRERWKAPAQPVLSALDRMLSLAVLSVLSMKLKEKDETQKHLNILKERFLSSCSKLQVPPRKHMKLASQQYHAETQKRQDGEKKLASLEENHRAVVSTLEEMEVNRDRLDEECRIMRSRLEEQEDNSQEVLQQREQAVLHLPPLPPRSQTDDTLQERLMRWVPDAGAVLKTLRKVPEMQQVNAFMELAHQHAHQRLRATTSVNTHT
ncbi:hypothetical protein ACEWY4_017000 [Coilia grayii]|uniref:Centromere protein Q n=1 Tax=Coilia grayii TaxID=363190 RepID=A0ABD1JM00_9TELE